MTDTVLSAIIGTERGARGTDQIMGRGLTYRTEFEQSTHTVLKSGPNDIRSQVELYVTFMPRQTTWTRIHVPTRHKCTESAVTKVATQGSKTLVLPSTHLPVRLGLP